MLLGHQTLDATLRPERNVPDLYKVSEFRGMGTFSLMAVGPHENFYTALKRKDKS